MEALWFPCVPTFELDSLKWTNKLKCKLFLSTISSLNIWSPSLETNDVASQCLTKISNVYILNTSHWKNVRSPCTAKVSHIFSKNNINSLDYKVIKLNESTSQRTCQANYAFSNSAQMISILQTGPAYTFIQDNGSPAQPKVPPSCYLFYLHKGLKRLTNFHVNRSLPDCSSN